MFFIIRTGFSVDGFPLICDDEIFIECTIKNENNNYKAVNVSCFGKGKIN